MADSRGKVHIAMLGCESAIAGAMGTSLIQGWLKSPSQEFTSSACGRTDASLQRIRTDLDGHDTQHAVDITTDFSGASQRADVVILGVPPTQLATLFAMPNLVQALRDKIIVSLLASVSCQDIANALSSHAEASGISVEGSCQIIRMMPTIGARMCTSVTLMSTAEDITEHAQDLCIRLFSQVGSVTPLPEHLIGEATAISIVSHALSIVSMDALTDAGVAEGLPRSLGLAIASQSLRSAADMVASGTGIEALKSSVSIPKSITINSVMQLERGSVRAAIADAVQHATSFTTTTAS